MKAVKLSPKLEKDVFEYLRQLDVAPYPVMFYEVPFTAYWSYLEDFINTKGIHIDSEYHDHIRQYSGKLKCYTTSLRLDTGVFKSLNEFRQDIIIKLNEFYESRVFINKRYV